LFKTLGKGPRTPAKETRPQTPLLRDAQLQAADGLTTEPVGPLSNLHLRRAGDPPLAESRLGIGIYKWEIPIVIPDLLMVNLDKEAGSADGESR